MLVFFDQGTHGPDRQVSRGPLRQDCQLSWDTLTNGESLKAAEDAGFDVLLTTDKNLVYQQNLKNRKIAIVVLGRNRWSILRAVIPQIVAAVNAACPGTHTLVEVPDE
jgi:hypothetical protein